MNDQQAGNAPARTAASLMESPPPQSSSLLEVAGQRLADLTALLALSSNAVSPLENEDFVHDLRVATRRVGELLRLLATFINKPAAMAIKKTLQSLRRILGDLRDGDVMHAHLLKWRMPSSVTRIAEEAAAGIMEKRPALVAAAAEQMASAAVQGATAVLAKILQDQSRPENFSKAEARLRRLLAKHLKTRRKQLKRAFGRAAIKQTPKTLHVARVAAKKLRYVVELAEASGTPAMKQELKFLKRLQELLGDHHDAHVVVKRLATHLQNPRVSAVPNLVTQWRQWLRTMNHAQAKRASDFFILTYSWHNRLR